MSVTREKIIGKLSARQFISGTQLEKETGVSRAAIWKHIQTLRNQGMPIESVPGKGYRLSYPVDLLDAKKISRYLVADVQSKSELHLLWDVDSSNNWLRNQLSLNLPSAAVCIAEQQSAGRGTKGRTWISPLGINLYLSFYWNFEQAPTELGGLSPAIAIAIVEALTEQGVPDLKVKWPNDIYTTNGKLGGVLIDMLAENNGPSRVIIGVGLNHGMSKQHQDGIEQPIDDLTWNKAISLNRCQLAAIIINTLFKCCQHYAENGFQVFHPRWKRWDMLQNKKVVVQMGNEEMTGEACGVDESGLLQLRTSQGMLAVCSGEVSLRGQAQ